MIVRVYIDDSGTDPKDQRMTLAALVGSLRQWQSVEPELKKLNRRFGLKEFRGSYISGLVAKGEWPPQKADQFIEEYAKITSRLLFRPSVSMNLWDYKEIFPSPSLRSRTRPEYSEIGVCFVFLLDILLIQTLQRRPTGKPIFHVVMEDRQGAGVTDQLWAAFKEKIIPDNLKSPNHTFARQGKGNICLGAADIFAWFVHRVVNNPVTLDLIKTSEQRWEPGQVLSLELTQENIRALRDGEASQDIGRRL